MVIPLKWFLRNLLKASPGKFQFMILGEKTYCKPTLVIDS